MGMPSDVRIKARTPDPLKQSAALGRRASLTPDMRREGDGGGGGVAVLRRADDSPSSRRRQSMPELPPIGAKPNSPGYAATRPPPGEPPAYAGKKSEPRKRPPPLSPASSSASLTATVTRSNSWLASELSNSMHSGRLETLFEGIDSRGGGGGFRVPAAAEQNGNAAPAPDDRRVVWSLGDAALPSKPPIRPKLSVDTSPGSLKSRSPVDDNRNVIPRPPAPPAAGSGGRAAASHGAEAPTALWQQQQPQPPPQLASRLSQENLNSLLRSTSGGGGGGGGGGSPDGYDSDKDKDERIMEWLVAVTNSSQDVAAGIPEISPLETEEKRDTAIHIVYNGD